MSSEEKHIRRPFNAGRFYPAEAERLNQLLEEFFSHASKDPEVKNPLAFMVPHAGYVFSGQCAAFAYKQIEGEPYQRAIVLAPSHYAHFSGASFFDGDAYETPLGLIDIDRAFVARLRQHNSLFHCHHQAHIQEHSLEVQLPFLQFALKQFQLVPLVISEQSWDNSQKVAAALAELLANDSLKSQTIIVASSDLYHGNSLETLRQQDQLLEDALARFQPQKFAEGIAEGTYSACGFGPVSIAMLLAQQLGAQHTKILKRTNSHEVYPLSEDYFVGYLAAAFY